MTKTLQRLLLCNVTEKKCKICRCRPEHAFDIHLPLGFLVYRVSSNFKSIWVSQSSFPTGFAPWWPCYSLDLFQSGQNLSHQHILIVVYGLIVKSCPTLCDPMDYSLPGSSVHGILQARILSGLPFPSLGDLPDPGIEPCLLSLLHWQEDSLLLPLYHAPGSSDW